MSTRQIEPTVKNKITYQVFRKSTTRSRIKELPYMYEPIPIGTATARMDPSASATAVKAKRTSRSSGEGDSSGAKESYGSNV